MKRSVILISAAVMLAGCLSSCARFKADDDSRFTATYKDYGADVMLTKDGELDQVFLQGPVGKSWLGDFEIHTGDTEDGREYLQLIRVVE